MTADQPATPAVDPTTTEHGASRPARKGRLRFSVESTVERVAGTTVLVLDTAWAPGPAEAAMPPTTGTVAGLRDVVRRVMRRRDLIAEAARSLDDWAEASGVVQDLAVEGTSFWYGERLRQWMWLLDEILWLAVIDELLAERPDIGAIDCGRGTDRDLVEAARLIARRDGLAFRDEDPPEPAGGAMPATTPAAEPTGARAALPRGRRPSLVRRILGRLRPTEGERRRRVAANRLARLAAEPERRLLVVQAHARQRIDGPAGPRIMNPYLGPIIERLRGSRLDPVEVDIRSDLADDEAWERLRQAPAARTLPIDVLSMSRPVMTMGEARATAELHADRVSGRAAPLVVAGVDLGPALTARVAARTRRSLPGNIRDVSRIRAIIRRLHPAGILLADEYHRQDWLAAAAAEGVPLAAVQHGVIYRWHTGYVHRTRPPELRLPARTYVFGPWEHNLLTSASVYRDDEVVVGGSPRLDLVTPLGNDRDAVRAELGVASGDRMVVLSGTWGQLYRRFHYPIALAGLFARPVPRVHLVVKLHPAERDDGPYRRIIEDLAAAGGFAPPPITIVQAIDLYRLLAAADAHLGIHSTLLTEAVATATPNLLASGLAASDLLDYVAAGVAIPVETTDDLLAALDRPRDEVMREADRTAFLRTHFEPGEASRRIADDLLAWLR